MHDAKRWIGCLIGLLLFSGSAWAKDLYIDDDAPGGGAGSKARPLSRLSTAIAKARSGDTLHVAAGTYRERLVLRGKALKLLGGYAAGFERRDPRTEASVLQGDGKDAVLTILGARGVTVEGFTIRGGGGSARDLPHFVNGGGVYVRGGDVTLKANLIEKNTTRAKGSAERAGGGIYAAGGAVTIVDNIIRHNTSRRGGGIAVVESKRARIEANRIEANISEGDHGGGLYLAESVATIARNRIIGNEVGRKLGYGWGGGVLVSGKRARVTLRRNTVRANFAQSLGSGVYVDDEARATFVDELIVENKCAQEGGSAVYVDGLDKKRGSEARFEHCTIVGHPCEGARGGEAVRAEQGSTVVIARSVFWNNGDDFSHDATSRIEVKESLTRDPIASAGQKTEPRFVAPKKGDYRLREPAAARGWGVRWGSPKGVAIPAPLKPKAAAPVGESASPKSSEPAKESCSIAGAPTAGIWVFLATIFLWSWRRRRRQR